MAKVPVAVDMPLSDAVHALCSRFQALTIGMLPFSAPVEDVDM